MLTSASVIASVGQRWPLQAVRACPLRRFHVLLRSVAYNSCTGGVQLAHLNLVPILFHSVFPPASSAL